MGAKTKRDGFGLEFYMGHRESDHTIFDIGMIYILSGEMTVFFGTGSFIAHHGDFFVLNAGQNYRWESNSECLFARLEISYKLFTDHMQTPYIYLMCNSTRRNFDDYIYNQVRNILLQLVREYTVPSPGFRKEYLWYNLMDVLVKNFIFHVPESFDMLKAGERMVYAMQFICANYSSELSLESAAEKMHLSTSAFSRWFKKQSGMNYGEFVQKVRLAHCTEDLLYTNKTVMDAAMDNGFSGASVFTKLFRKKYGMTPTDYRKEHKSSLLEKEVLIEQVKNSAEMKQNDSGQEKQAQKSILVNPDQTQPWHNQWNQSINVGEAIELMSARMQKQILFLHEQLGFKYVRISNIFSNKLKIRRKHSTVELNYDSLDAIFDFIISNGMRPFIDLCDRQHSALLAITESLYREQREEIFVSEEEMLSVVFQIFRHFTLRYGVDEVSSWLVECWYDDHQQRVMGLDLSYSRVFQKMYHQIKYYAPNIKIGGFGLAPDISEHSFLNIVGDLKKGKCIPDFISIYIYPYTSFHSRLSDFDYTLEQLERCHSILKQYGMDKTPIYVTEWNVSVSVRNFYNDSSGKAAMLLRHAISVLNQAEMLTYSMASDMVVNYYDSSRLLFGAPGLLTKDGLCKPVFYALLFMSYLKGKLLSLGPEHIITMDGKNKYHILLFNAKPLSYKYYLQKEYMIQPEEINELFENESVMGIDLNIVRAESSQYYAKYEILDDENGNLMKSWMDMGDTEALTVKDMDYLKNTNCPRVVFKKIITDKNTIRLREKLEPHEVKYIHIYPEIPWEK